MSNSLGFGGHNGSIILGPGPDASNPVGRPVRRRRSGGGERRLEGCGDADHDRARHRLDAICTATRRRPPCRAQRAG
ncbi:MAG: hypothetical protein R2713_12035 [Ilumatobacteraceae bacterium]